MNNFWVYVLESKSKGRYYVGCTNNISRRVRQHNKGCIKSTKHGIPWVLKYKEIYHTLSVARRREKQIKDWKSRKSLEKLFKAPSSNG